MFALLCAGLAVSVTANMQCSAALEFTSTKGGLYANGQRFRLKGLSWFGFETSNNVFHGLWAVDYNFLLDFIADNKFNAMRVPFYLDLVLNDAQPTSINTYCQNNHTCNRDIANKTSLQVLDRVIEAAAGRGILIMLDLHSFRPGTFMQDGLWYDSEHPEALVMKGWDLLIARYKNQWNVIAVDIKNEPKDTTWGTGNMATDWNSAVERIGSHIANQTGWLIFAEGTSNSPDCGGDPCFWGEDLIGARDHPIKLSVPNKLVYSPHVYGPDVAYQKYFVDPSFPSNMDAIWQKHWSFVREKNAEAVVVGEWGGKTTGNNGVWMKQFTTFLKRIDAADNFFWCLNPDSGDTGGLLDNDWITPQVDKLAVLADLQPNPTIIKKQGDLLCLS